jgi:hypothetical protein
LAVMKLTFLISYNFSSCQIGAKWLLGRSRPVSISFEMR